jgi:hypothetical protein
MAVFDHTDWNLAQTFTWICLRDREQLERASMPYIVSGLETVIGPVVYLSRAESEMREGLSSESICCTGVREGRRETIPPTAWHARSFLPGSVIDRASEETWEDVLFVRRDVLAIWPPQGDAALPAAPVHSQRAAQTGPKPGKPSPKDQWYEYAKNCLESGEIAATRGATAEIARRIQAEPLWRCYATDTIEKAVRQAVKERGNRKSPEISGK